MATENNNDTLGPPDKKEKYGLKVYRADYLPDFVTEDWVRDNVGLTLQDQTTTAKNFAKLFPSWDGKEGLNGTFHAKMARDLGIAAFAIVASGTLRQKNKKKEPLFLKEITETIFAHMTYSERRKQKSFSTVEAWLFLIEKEAWEDLAQVVFVDILYRSELDEIENLLAKHKELNRAIYPFFNSYKDQLNKFERRLSRIKSEKKKTQKSKEETQFSKSKEKALKKQKKELGKEKSRAKVKKTNKTRVTHDDGTNEGSAFFKGIINKINDAKGESNRKDLTDLITEIEEFSRHQIVTETKFQSQVDEKITELVLSLSNLEDVASTVAGAIINGDTAAMTDAAATTLQIEDQITRVISELQSIMAKAGIKENIETSSTDPSPDSTRIVLETEIETNLEFEEDPLEDENAAKVNKLVTRLLDGQHSGLAYYAQKFGDEYSQPDVLHFSSPLLRLLTISPSLVGPIEDVTRLKSIQSLIENNQRLMTNGSTTVAKEALLVASTLEPALFCTQLGTIDLIAQNNLPSLKHLSSLFSALTDVIRPIAQLPGKGLGEITRSTIQLVQDGGISKLTLEMHQNNLKEWFERTKTKKPIGLARNIWQNLTKPKGEIGKIITNLVAGKKVATKDAEAFLTSLNKSADVDALINKNQIKGNPIATKSKKALRSLISEAKTSISSYVGFITASEGPSSSHEHRVITDLSKNLTLATKNSIAQIDDWLLNKDNEIRAPHEIAAIKCLHRSLDRLLKIVSGTAIEPIKQRSEEELLGRDLSLVCGVQFNGPWEPSLDQHEVFFLNIKNFLEQSPIKVLEIWDQQIKDRNHIATTHLFEMMRHNNDPEIDARRLEELDKELEQAIGTSRAKLASDLEDAKLKVDRAMVMNLINDNEHTKHLEQLNGITPENLPNLDIDNNENNSVRFVDFPAAENIIKIINEKIDDEERTRCIELEATLQTLFNEKRCSPEDRKSVQTHIQDGDLLLVEYCLDALSETESLPKITRSNVHIKKFSEFSEKTYKNIKEKKRRRQLSKADALEFETTSKFAGQNFSNLRRENKEAANTLLRSWTSLGGSSKETINRLYNILAGIGFGVIDHDIRNTDKKSSKYPEFVANCRHIDNPDTCRVPQYGSHARGRYRIILINQAVTTQELIETATANEQSATLIFYRSAMNALERKTFVRGVFESTGSSALLIDDLALLYLCKCDEFRLPVMFQITLPYTNANPFWKDRGKTPVEMFYGRGNEQKRLLGPADCLVYGGRMLGKTALLHQIHGKENRPERGKHVIYEDILYPEILTERKAHDFKTSPEIIWELIAKNLHKRKIIKLTPEDALTADNIIPKIRNWIDEDPDHKILLLFDEADEFLKLDAQNNHQNVGMLKNLMDRTDGRFKIIMAGLHDVQRTTTINDVNSPISRLGQPICIGPLKDLDRLAASNLITEPLSACGYEFESPDLVMKILSLTNSYPSLIQVFCHALLTYISNQRSLLKNGPPYKIDKSTLDGASQDGAMRAGIVAGFKATLELDPRYEFIARVITLESLHDVESGTVVQGFSPRQIREEVLSYGSGPFGEDSSSTIFGALLDEMVGLGILNEDNGYYQLKSTSVRSMMGSLDHIGDRILELAGQLPRTNYNPQNSHRFSKNDGHSPLTRAQEADLLDKKEGRHPNLFLVFGFKLAGIEEVERVIKSRASEENRNFIEKGRLITKFEELNNLVKQNKTKRKNRPIIVVPREVPWSAVWISKALELPEIKKRQVELYFLGDGNTLLDWIQNGKPGLNKDNTYTTHLTPWSSDAINQWVKDEDLSTVLGNEEVLRHLRNKTGHYTEMLTKFRKSLGKGHDASRALKNLDIETRGSADLIEDCGIPISIRSLIAEVRRLADFDPGSGLLHIDQGLFEMAAEELEMQVDSDHLREWGDRMTLWEPASENKLRLSTVIFDIVESRQ